MILNTFSLLISWAFNVTFKKLLPQRLPSLLRRHFGGFLINANSAYHVSPYRATWMLQFLALLWRNTLIFKRDPKLFKIKILNTLVGW